MREYIELEAPGERVKHAELVMRERVFGHDHEMWDVRTQRSRH